MAESLLNTLDKRNLSTQVAARIRDYILQKGLKSGDQLPTESELMESLGVSRSTVREALRSLKSSGILESVRGQGTRIKRFDYSEAFGNLLLGLSVATDEHSIVKLAEARYTVEICLAPLVAKNITDQDLRELELCYQRNARAKQRAKRLHWDTRFHQQLVESSHNKYLFPLALIILEWFGTEQVSTFLAHTAGPHEKSVMAHARIVEACRRRDGAMLQEALRTHLAAFGDFRLPETGTLKP